MDACNTASLRYETGDEPVSVRFEVVEGSDWGRNVWTCRFLCNRLVWDATVTMRVCRAEGLQDVGDPAGSRSWPMVVLQGIGERLIEQPEAIFVSRLLFF